MDKHNGKWANIDFHVTDYDENGRPMHAHLAITEIDETDVPDITIEEHTTDTDGTYERIELWPLDDDGIPLGGPDVIHDATVIGREVVINPGTEDHGPGWESGPYQGD